ncbi:MAG: protein kinase [Deltaproteobacteria bacterium]|nr:protein kinase [Deltaproteobacteria bacterium]
MNPNRWKQLEPILDAALDLPPQERSAYLEEACGTDLELRAEVEGLLEDCDNSGSFLEQAGGVALSEIAATSPYDPLALQRIGDRLGSYRLEKILGQGGMGTVYLANRVDGLFDQKVAIKIASRQNLDQEAIERFRFERQLLARLEHPNIARLLDGGVTQDDVPYLVMEWVDGVPLDTYCEALPVLEKLELVQETCRAVAYAHRRKVVHRDIKPGNVLVTSEGRVKLLDFGIAELLGQGEEDLSRHEGQVSSSSRLTLGYAAPELLIGKDATSSSDLYSLGVLLFRLLAGQLPFEPSDRSFKEWKERVLEAPPPLPSQNAPRPLPRSRDLDAVILKALSKSPRQRYSSAEALAEDLQRLRDRLPVHARPQTVGYLLRSNLRRNPIPWLIGAITAGLLLFASGGWVQSRQKALRRAELAQRFGQEAERIEWFLRHAQALPQHDIRRERRIMEERLESLQLQMSQLGDLATGPGHFALGRGYARLGRPELAAKHLRQAWDSGYRTAETALALGKALGEVYDLERNGALRIRDPQLRAKRIVDLEARFLEPAQEFLQQGGSPELQSSNQLFASIAYYDDRLDEAVRLAQKAQAEAPWEPESLRLEADIYLRQAAQHTEQGQFEKAEVLFPQAFSALAAALELAPSNPTLYQRVCWGWEIYQEMSRFRPQGSEDGYERGLEACQQALKVDPENLEAWHGQAVLHLSRARDSRLEPATIEDLLIQAEEASRSALAISSNDAVAYQTLGSAMLFRVLRLESPQGKDLLPGLEKAAKAFRRAIEMDSAMVTSYANLGTARALAARQLISRGQNPMAALSEAITCFDQALDRAPDRALLAYNLANLYLDRGKFEATHGEGDPRTSYLAALARGRRALELNPNLVQGLNLLGSVEESLGQLEMDSQGDPSPPFERAWDYFQQALEINPAYHLAAFNQVSVLRSQSEAAASRGLDPLPSIRRAIELSDRLEDQVGTSDVDSFQQLTEPYLLRAQLAAAAGESPRSWLESARKLSQAGLNTHPKSAVLQIQYAMEAFVRERWEGISSGSSCLAPTRARLAEALVHNPLETRGHLLLAEAQLWCARGSVEASDRQHWLEQAKSTLGASQVGASSQRFRRALEASLGSLEAQQASPHATAPHLAKDRLEAAIGKDLLLQWRFGPFLAN